MTGPARPKGELDNITIVYQNVRGLRTKLKQFYTSLASSGADIICVTESWLNSSIADGEVVDNTYSIFRKDRESTLNQRQRGVECSLL